MKTISTILGVMCFLLIFSFSVTQVRAQENYDPKAFEYFREGGDAIDKEKYDKAIKLFTKTIKIEPKFYKAYFYRALSYARMNKFDEAFPDYNKAIEINPDYALAYVGRGSVFQNKKMTKEALSDYNKAIELGTDDPVAYYNRGVIYLEEKMGDRGIADFLKATNINPKYYQAFYNLACVYSLNKDEGKALLYLEKAVQTGFKKLDILMKDPDFDNIRNSEGFKKIIEKLKAK